MVVAACSSGSESLPPVPKFRRAATTTTGIDYSQIGLRGVGSRPTTTIALGPGKATVSGIVLAPDGAVPNAQVAIERVVNGQIAGTVVISIEDGTFSIPSILGGRYRLRAWRAPDLAQTTATTLFLGSTETKSVELHVHAVDALDVQTSIAPDPPSILEPSNLVVQVSHKTVGDDGVVRATPLQGARVELIGSSNWRVQSANPAFADFDGRASYTVQCRDVGHQALAVSVGSEQTVPVTISDCIDPTVFDTTTTLDENGNPPAEFDDFSTTTTTRRR